MISFIWKIMFDWKTLLKRMMIFLIMAIVIIIPKIKTDDEIMEEHRNGAMMTLQINKRVENLEKSGEEKGKDYHQYYEFIHNTNLANQSLLDNNLSDYLLYFSNATKYGETVYENFPEFFGYGSIAMEVDNVPFKTAKENVRRIFIRDYHKLDFYNSKLKELSFSDVLRSDFYEIIGENKLFSNFFLILFLIVVLMMDLILSFEVKDSVWRTIPKSFVSYQIKKKLISTCLVFGVQVFVSILVFVMLLLTKTINPHIVPSIVIFSMNNEATSVSVFYFMIPILFIVFLLDSLFIMMATILFQITRSKIFSSSLILFVLFLERMMIHSSIYKHFPALSPIYYIDTVSALNGNKSLIYNYPFSYMDACKSIFMYICLLFILLILIIKQQDRRCKYGNK
jgi:membrane protein